MSERSCLAIVLAAGEGTRMRATLPKVLHPIAGRTLIGHVLAAVSALDYAERRWRARCRFDGLRRGSPVSDERDARRRRAAARRRIRSSRRAV